MQILSTFELKPGPDCRVLPGIFQVYSCLYVCIFCFETNRVMTCIYVFWCKGYLLTSHRMSHQACTALMTITYHGYG